MPMSFGFGRWPAVVTHLGCLTLGILLMSLGGKGGEPTLKIPARWVAIALPKTAIGAAGTVRVGDKVRLVVRRRGGGLEMICSLSESTAVVLQGETRPVIALSASEAVLVLSGWDALRSKGDEDGAFEGNAGVVSWALEESTRGLPRCGDEPKVTYGDDA